MKKQNIQKRDVEAELLSGTFDYLVENGLENFSMRELCKHTGISVGSIYYWFDNKDELIISAAQYGLSKVSESIFDFVLESIDDLEIFFSVCLDRIKKSATPLKVIFQIFTSPLYGPAFGEHASGLNVVYSRYSQKISEIVKCNEKEMEALVHIFISVITDFVICNNLEATKISLNYLYELFKKASNTK